MANEKAKTINLLLYDGTLKGVISIEDSSWNSGELYSAPRDSVNDLLEMEACKKYGVYLLYSTERVYIGQSNDLARRITQHISGKEWWSNVILLTTKDDSLTHSDIDFLEAKLIGKASSVGSLDCDNKTKGNDPKIDKFRAVMLTQFLNEALFLIELIGVHVFSPKVNISTPREPVVVELPGITAHNTVLSFGKNAKNAAIHYFLDHGVSLPKKTSYATLSEGSAYFWCNPNVSVLNDDWYLILNNTLEHELILCLIKPSIAKSKKDDFDGFVVRKDNDKRIDLKIDMNTLKDKSSNFDFLPFVINRVNY